MDIMSRRTYLFIGVGVGLFLFLIGTFLGASVVTFADRLPLSTTGVMQSLAQFVIEPIKLVMLNPLPGAIIAGLLWPLVGLWVALLLLIVIVAAAAGVQVDINTQTPLR